MDNKSLIDVDHKQDSITQGSHSQSPPQPLRREVDSLDDFEHLGHDSSPLSENLQKEQDLLGLHSESPAGKVLGAINTGVESAASAASKITDDIFDPFKKETESLIDKLDSKMDSNLLQMGDSFPDRKEADAKLDKFLSDFTSSSSEKTDSKEKESYLDDFKSASKAFVDIEREMIQPLKPSVADVLDRYSDSEPELEEFKQSNDFDKKELSSSPQTFKDVEEIETSVPKQDFIHREPSPAPPPKVPTPEPVPQKKEEPAVVKAPEPPKKEPELPKKEHELPKKQPELPKNEPEKQPERKIEQPPKVETVAVSKKPVIEAEAMFCKMGLDAWFHPERLNPKVESLIYWRDPKKSGPVFGGVLVVLLALSYFSLISVIAYLSLLGLTGTISFRIYKNIVQAIQKTGDGHPFKEFLEVDVSLPQDKVKEISEIAVAHINAIVTELRRLFLVEDLVDSIKFGVLLWSLTYLGAWFNGMTLIIIAWVALFTLPKVYEANKTQIDKNLEIVRSKLAEITSKVKAAIPIGKKAEEKKEQ